MKKSLAPNWVMMGTLALIIVCAISPIMSSLGFITPETISFSSEFGGSVSVGIIPGSWILNAILALYFVAVAVAGFAKGWNWMVPVGALLVAVSQTIQLWIPQTYLAATNYSELLHAAEVAGVAFKLLVLLYLAGNLLVAFGTAIPKSARIMFAVLIGWGVLTNFVYPGDTASTAWACVVRPLFAAVILYFCIPSKPSHKVAA